MEYVLVFLGICTAMLIGFNAGHLIYLASAGSKKDRIKVGIASGVLGFILALLCIFS